MAGPYESIWMTGSEALEFLLPVEPDVRKRIALLQAAERDERARGRARGLDADRRWRAHYSLGDPDADESWRRKFIDVDAAYVDPAQFAEQSEFLREAVITWFGRAREASVRAGTPLESSGHVRAPKRTREAPFADRVAADVSQRPPGHEE
jgi:hypothetical protein